MSLIQVCCEGYERNVHNFRKCDPICTNGCVNGFCFSPDVCMCYPDHVRNLGGFCLPTCPIMCGNGFCNSDNTCTCKDGFILEQNGKFCVPKCSNCQNGNCTAPEECTCNKGFTLSSNGKCEHYCSKGCRNGDCVAPEVCNCHRGYSMVNDVCEPLCPRFVFSIFRKFLACYTYFHVPEDVSMVFAPLLMYANVLETVGLLIPREHNALHLVTNHA